MNERNSRRDGRLHASSPRLFSLLGTTRLATTLLATTLLATTLLATTLLATTAVVAIASRDLSADEGGAAVADGAFRVTLRSRQAAGEGGEEGESFLVEQRTETWKPRETAVIVCDMWDLHHCKNATERVGEMAPVMNRVLKKARGAGALIVHAPSSCMGPYKDHPARQRARSAPAAANLPSDIGEWCHRIPAEEKGTYPLDQSDGGCDSVGEPQAAFREHLVSLGKNPGAPWTRQIDTLEIHDDDAISDSGVEIWNLLESRTIRNVILVGVHTNMCVLGRPFGLRQMAKNGKNVVLMRDMTDTMYNPQRWPWVSHFQGNRRIVEHIEKYVCPTITSDQLIGGRPFVFRDDHSPRITIAIAEPEYGTDRTLPAYAKKHWETTRGYALDLIVGDPEKHDLSGLAEKLPKSDLLVVSIRRQALPAAELEAIRAHVAAGRPLVAIRTSSHAFEPRNSGPKGRSSWPEFDHDVLGGNYRGHHGRGPVTRVAHMSGSDHPILRGVPETFTSHASLYRTGPIAADATPLLLGRIDGQRPEPIAWARTYGPRRARVVYTSLGHEKDFSSPGFQRLLENAVEWALGHDVPERAAPKPANTESRSTEVKASE